MPRLQYSVYRAYWGSVSVLMLLSLDGFLENSRQGIASPRLEPGRGEQAGLGVPGGQLWSQSWKAQTPKTQFRNRGFGRGFCPPQEFLA